MKLMLDQPRFIYKLVTALALTLFLIILMQQTADAAGTAPILAGTSITIDVKDSISSIKVSNAEVTLTSTALPFPLKLKADASGLYNIINLPLGEYSMTVSAPGYVTSSNISIGTLTLNQNNSRTVQLVADSSLVGINDLNFNDTNNSPDIIAGIVSCTTYGTLPTDALIQVQLFNDQNAPVGVPLSSGPASSYFQFNILGTTIPADATRIGVQLISNAQVIGKKTIPMWRTTLNPTNFKFIDSNSNLGINGSISWTGLTDESQIGGYRIYYWLKGDSSPKYWNVVGKRTDKIYQYSFASLPAGTGAIALGISNLAGEEQNSYPTIYVIDNRLTDTVLTAANDANLPIATNVINNTATYSNHTISGSISWTTPTDISLIRGYNLYYSNSTGDKIQAIGTRYLAGTNSSASLGSAYFDLGSINNSALSVPSGATQFALYTLGNNDSESAPIFIPIKPFGGPCASPLPSGLTGTSISIYVNDPLSSCSLTNSNTDVTLTSAALPFPLTMKANPGGVANFINLPAGDYAIQVSSIGYRTSALIPIGTLSLNQNNIRNVSLVYDSSLPGFSSLYFYDTNNTPGIIAGTVSWSAFGTIPTNAQVQVQFYDDQNTPVGVPLTTVPTSTTQFILPNTTVPLSATRFGVQLISNNVIIAQKTMPIWEYESVHPLNLRFVDTNRNLGINGSVSWKGAVDESKIGGYRIYYSVKGSTLNYVDVVGKKSSDKMYTYTFNSPLPDNTGAIFIGINSLNGEELNAYPAAFALDNRLSDLVSVVAYSPTLPVPSNIRDYTNTYSPNTISGQIAMDVPKDVSQIKGFNLYFSNSAGVKVQTIATSYLEGSNPGNYISLDDLTNSSLPIPSGATQFALYSLGVDGSESAPIYIPIKTYGVLPSTKLPFNIKFIDLDPQLQKIHGFITWSRAVDESTLSSYRVYYLDNYDQPLSMIGEVLKGSLPQLTIPASFSLPSGAAKIGIFVKNSDSTLNSNSIKIPLYDNDSLSKISTALKVNYFPTVKQLGIEHFVPLLNDPSSSVTYSKDDIGLFLLLIESKILIN